MTQKNVFTYWTGPKCPLIEELEELKREIKEETKVPLSYMGEYYDLIMHLELIISKANIKISHH